MQLRPVAFSLLTSAVLVAAACGGAIDNSELYPKEAGTTSGSSGTTSGSSGTTSGSPGATATAGPTVNPAPGSRPAGPSPNPNCNTSFELEVLTAFADNSCGSPNCHGGPGPSFWNDPIIDVANPGLTYKALISYKMSDGKPYVAVGNTNPRASGMFCNVRGECGSLMPPGSGWKLSKFELGIVDKWLACGAPFN